MKWPIKNINEIKWQDLELGGAITEPGSSRFYKTGDWRSFRPEIDREGCIKCYFCYVFCPEGAVQIREDGFTEINYDYCKGCGICAKECKGKVIKMVEEEV